MSLLKWIILSMIGFSGVASADNTVLSAKAGSWSFTTEHVTGRSESSSGFGAYALEAGYAFFPKVLAVFGANVLMSDGISGSTGFGFDLGARYYPFTDATQAITRTDNTYIRVQEKWRPYVGGFFRQRDFNIALQSGYVGPGVSLGTDYNYSKNWHASFEIRYDMLYGSGERTATQTNILVGVGVEL